MHLMHHLMASLDKLIIAEAFNNIMYGRKTKSAGKGSCGERGGKKGK